MLHNVQNMCLHPSYITTHRKNKLHSKPPSRHVAKQGGENLQASPLNGQGGQARMFSFRHVSVAWWGVMFLLQQIFIESPITRNAVIDAMSAPRSSSHRPDPLLFVPESRFS